MVVFVTAAVAVGGGEGGSGVRWVRAFGVVCWWEGVGGGEVVGGGGRLGVGEGFGGLLEGGVVGGGGCHFLLWCFVLFGGGFGG